MKFRFDRLNDFIYTIKNKLILLNMIIIMTLDENLFYVENKISLI